MHDIPLVYYTTKQVDEKSDSKNDTEYPCWTQGYPLCLKSLCPHRHGGCVLRKSMCSGPSSRKMRPRDVLQVEERYRRRRRATCSCVGSSRPFGGLLLGSSSSSSSLIVVVVFVIVVFIVVVIIVSDLPPFDWHPIFVQLRTR